MIQAGGAVIVELASAEIVAGQSARFAVAAAGEELTYQWYKNDSPIVGANSAAHIIPTTSTNDTGNYYVVVANPAGSATSQKAFFLVAN